MKTIYQIVLDANMAAMKHVKAGQKWSNLTKTASFTILSGLISGNFCVLYKVDFYMGLLNIYMRKEFILFLCLMD